MSIRLSSEDQAVLTEIINMGFGRAANALSMLVNQRVLLEAPLVEIYPLKDLAKGLSDLSSNEIINVHQSFRGKLSGDAMLLMDKDSATVLVDMLEGGKGTAHPMTAADREALVEMSNIVLNAFIGSFGNLLRGHITFTVPHLKVETLSDLLGTLAFGNQEVEFALVLRIHFRLTQGDVSGYVMIVMGIQSLETLMEAMRSEGYTA
jgi:chemotaxis protein CheC